MKHKILNIFLLGTLLLSLTGCGERKELTTEANEETSIDIDTEKESSTSTNEEDYIQVGSHSVHYGTYRGQDGATGELLVLFKSGYATWNGSTYKFSVEKYDFSQDISSTSVLDAIVLKKNDNTIVYAVYVGSDGNLYNDPGVYIFES